MRVLIFLLAVSWSMMLRADPVSEYEMKATYLFNFATFSEWPDSERATFNLCTLGEEEVGKALLRLDGRRLHGRRLVIARLTSLTALRNCQVLFVGEREVVNLPKIIAQLGEEPVLTVVDRPVSASVGIQMALEGRRLVFDVNVDQCRQAGVKPSSTLLRLARNVRMTK